MASWHIITLLRGNQSLKQDVFFMCGCRSLYCKNPCSNVFTWIKLDYLCCFTHFLKPSSPVWPLQHLDDLFVLITLNYTQNISFLNYVWDCPVWPFLYLHKRFLLTVYNYLYTVWSVLHQELPGGDSGPATFFIQSRCLFNKCLIIKYA